MVNHDATLFACFLAIAWHAVLPALGLSVSFNVTQCPVEDGDAAVVGG